MKRPLLYIVIPCYNEQEVLPVTAPLFLNELVLMTQHGLINEDSKILFIDDGSKDNTWEIIKSLSKEDPHYCGIRQSRNRGHQNAVLAGLMEAKDLADITISIDCDGQDDITAMDEMVKAYLDGYEVVYGVRSKRETDTFFKRFTAEGFYKVLKWMGADVVFNHADYRLISSVVLQEFSRFEEVNLFLRGMIPLVGYPSTSVFYERHERIAGESHYPLKKMLGLAVDGITSMSTKPLTLIFGTGLTVFSVSAVCCLVALILLLAGKGTGLLLACALMAALSGLQILCLGVVGAYVGKSYMETKHRPRYIISERVGLKGGNNDNV